MSSDAAAAAFPEAAFRSHRRHADRISGKPDRKGAVLRATGDVLVPASLSGHVEFISGLTELWVADAPGSGTGKLDGGGGRFGSLGGMEVCTLGWRGGGIYICRTWNRAALIFSRGVRSW